MIGEALDDERFSKHGGVVLHLIMDSSGRVNLIEPDPFDPFDYSMGTERS